MLSFGLWFSWLIGWATPGGELPDVEKNRWIKQGLAHATREGLLFAYPGHRWGRREPSRYEQAVAFHATVTSHLGSVQQTLEGRGDDRTRAMLGRTRSLLPFYRRATLEFAPELLSLGVTDEPSLPRLEFLTGWIDQSSQPRHRLFSDVPTDHWAAKAVGDLRALGLLDGYPDGRFRG